MGRSYGATKRGIPDRIFPRAAKHEPRTLGGEKLKVAFRCDVLQDDKRRACDDIRHSMANLACRAETPINLSYWSHIAEMWRRIAPQRAWHFFKDGQPAAYKKLPIELEQSALNVIALRPPYDGRWYGFMGRTSMYGAIADVLHSNVSPRTLSDLMRRIFGIPTISNSDDFGSSPLLP